MCSIFTASFLDDYFINQAGDWKTEYKLCKEFEGMWKLWITMALCTGMVVILTSVRHKKTCVWCDNGDLKSDLSSYYLNFIRCCSHSHNFWASQEGDLEGRYILLLCKVNKLRSRSCMLVQQFLIILIFFFFFF